MGRGGDGRLTTFLRVDYEQLRGRVLEGGTDGEILEWCYRNGRRFCENDVIIWNGFVSKMGWNDAASEYLAESKAAAGLSGRDDIQTMIQLFEVEEGRRP